MNKDKPLQEGTECWFEYRCFESHASSDAQLWYRSQQRVTVVGCRNPEEAEGDECDTYEKRTETAEMLEYDIRFADGFEGIAIEDELLGSRGEFCRQAPPPPPDSKPTATQPRTKTKQNNTNYETDEN